MDRADLIALPKAELHLHLELSMQPDTAAELARRYGRPTPATGPWPNQEEFVAECEQVRDLIDNTDELARVAFELVQAADRQGIWWTEVTCAPFNYHGRLGAEALVVEAILDGLTDGAATTGRGVGVILAHNRAQSQEIGRTVLDLCEKYRADAYRPVGVVALGLVGAEVEYPPGLHQRLFADARRRGVPRVPHAGEGDGPPAIREAWQMLHADRVAHGVRAAEDPRLVQELASAHVCLDVCPTSNVLLAASPSLQHHQLPTLVQAGVPVSLGSDTTLLAGVDLVDEYRHLITHMGLSESQVAAIARASLEHSFAPAELVSEAMAELDKWSAARLPLPDGVGQVRHPRGGLRADGLQGHAARVHALEQADSGAEQHG